jgi:phosphohistidine phosphatase SixA
MPNGDIMIASRLRSFIRASSALALLSFGTPALAQKAIVVVRHAEKVDESADPALSAAGIARAEALARALKRMDIKAVYVTQYQRTRLTADPVLKARGLTPIEIHADKTPELAERMKKEFPNDVVLTVGHSNSVPRLLKILGVTESIEIAHDEYDNLFIVVPAAAGPPALIRLSF